MLPGGSACVKNRWVSRAVSDIWGDRISAFAGMKEKKAGITEKAVGNRY